MKIDARLYQHDLKLLRDLCRGETLGKDNAAQRENVGTILDELCGQPRDVIVAFAPDESRVTPDR